MDLKRATSIIDKYPEFSVLVVGDVLLDHYVQGVVERINPEAPVPILRVQEERQETGGAGNVAKNLSTLGAKAVLLSVSGDDDAAGELAQAAMREGYEAHLIRDGGRPTIRKVRHLVGDQHMLRVDYEDVHDIEGEIEKQLIAALSETVPNVDAIIVSDYAKGTITARVAEEVLRLAGEHDLIVAADVKPSRASYFLGATLVSPNIKEAHEFLGYNYHERQLAPHDLAKSVYSKMCSDVFLTLGKDGMYVFCGGERGAHIRQEHVIEIADESGAGDTSIVVLLLSLLAGANAQEAATIANAGGAAVVTKIGSVGISVADLKGMLSSAKDGE